jgi:hypothetical protein
MTDELRKLAEAVIGAPEMKSYVWPTASNEITVCLGEEEAAFIAEADPAAVIALLDRIEDLEASNRYKYGDGYEAASIALIGERDEARAAVKRLAGALFDLLHGCSVDAPKNADEALADPVVRRIVEGE